ncbi:unnamed protein product [Amaranthus hypochondriacus]
MGGGKRKPTNKSRPRGQRQSQSLFIDGGILSDFDSPSSSSSRRGKRGNLKSGNSASGSNCNFYTGVKQSPANYFRYDYPSIDFKDVVQSEPPKGEKNGEGSSVGLQPVILLGSKDSKIVAFEEPTPSMEPSKVEYYYEYSSGFVLGESSHGELGFSDEPEETLSVTELSSGILVDEEEQLHRGLGFSEHSKVSDNGGLLASTIVQETLELFNESSTHGMEEEMEDGEGSMDEEDNIVDEDEDEDEDKDEDEDEGGDGDGDEDSSCLLDKIPVKTSSRKKNSAFVSIGGVRLYTQDLSDEEDGEEVEDCFEEGSSSESSESDNSEDSSEFESDIDEDVMQDYLDRCGGVNEILKSKWLALQHIDGQEEGDDSHNDSSTDEYGETLKKLGGVALEEASKKYGMQKKKSKKKPSPKSSKLKSAEGAWSSTLDDLMLVKDPRQFSARKKHAAQFPQSWPSGGRKNKKYGRFPGTTFHIIVI